MIKSSIHTFYSRTLTQPNEVFDFDSLVLTSLSVLFARKLFHRMYFFGDNLSNEILIKEMGLPFDIAGTDLQFFLPKPLSKYWSLAKIKACASVYEPFVHIDNDVVLHKALPDIFLQSDLVGQHTYSSDLAPAINSLPFNTEVTIKNSTANTFANAGLIGGEKWEVFADVWDSSYSTASNGKNRSVLFPDNNTNRDLHNQFFEEYMLGVIAKDKNLKISGLFPNPPTEEQAVLAGYTHLAGDMKKQVYWIARARKKLLDIYPEVYMKIDDITKKYQLFKLAI